jgi:hypothetical protein
MKRMIFSGAIILVLASMVFVSHAETQKVALSKDNLADLKGEWRGSRDVQGRGGLDTDLEISNDSLPLEVKLTFYRARKKGRGASAEETQIHNFKAKINDQGNLFFKGSNSELELSLYKDNGSMKLEGNFYWSGSVGTMSLKKK